MQHLPTSGPERERLRQKGQFWTPDWVADAMVSYVLLDNNKEVFDPAVGAGAFFRAATRVGGRLNRRVQLCGTELHENALLEAAEEGVSPEVLARVMLRDFVLDPPPGPYRGIVANPPYIRHHRLPARIKSALRSYGRSVIGTSLDGRAGIHIYFLLRALQLLAPGGRLAFIVSADTAEGVFAADLWDYIGREYDIEGVVTFDSGASPFPNVDTNPIIYLIRNQAPSGHLNWARCVAPDGTKLLNWVALGMPVQDDPSLSAIRRDLKEALELGLSRAPVAPEQLGPQLSEFATVCRGIATGANKFFLFTEDAKKSSGIPDDYFVRVVGRTRDVPGSVVDSQTMSDLEKDGRPSYLLSINGDAFGRLPVAVQEHIRRGENSGVSQGALLRTRSPWYRMETRRVPQFLFAYLGRRSARFIRNEASVVPLTGFLCVYPRCNEPSHIDKLWAVLSHPATEENLRLVGKSYGGGAIKVEPRALEALPLPAWLVKSVGLVPPQQRLCGEI